MTPPFDQESELQESLILLASCLKVEDAEDPEIFTKLSQLVSMLDPQASPLPEELIEQLSGLPKAEDRFTQAALALKATTPDQLSQLADSMRASGLLKSESYRSRLSEIRGRKITRHALHSFHEFRSALKEADAIESMFKSDLAKSFGGQKVRDVADAYATSKGLKLDHNLPNHQIVPEHSAKIAQAYADMKHEPNHPDVKRAYGALINETTDQFRHIMKSGLKISRITPGMENPYKGGSKDLIHDVHNNNHMWYYPTEGGFGSGEVHQDHPLLAPTTEKHGGHTLLGNDVLRVVHDYVGHCKEGHSFGPRGEDNAWKHHMQMYSPEAQKALTSELRGQNSYVNFSKEVGAHNRANPADTIFAPQRAGLLPAWTMEHPDLVRKSLVSSAQARLSKPGAKK